VTGAQGHPPAIEVNGLVKRYRQRSVVDGVSFAVAWGEICVLLGPNGAGKTTTAEIIEGYRRPDAGSVRVLGTDPAAGGRGHRARVGVMLQEGGIDPRMRPAETIRLYARLSAAPRDPHKLLDLVGLRTVASTPYRRLSGGERQRLGLALALVGSPDVLVLDEPTAGMDPEAKAATRGLLSDLRSGGTAILVTTHELHDVERLADRILVMSSGRLVAAGTRVELLAGASGRLDLRLESELSEADRHDLGALLGGVLVADAGGRYRLEGIAPDPGLIAMVAGWCAQRGLTILELRTTGATLEERYLALVGGDR
jgi:ABC-2 type transport system ATP-binding protein